MKQMVSCWCLIVVMAGQPQQADKGLPKIDEALQQFEKQFEPAFKRMYLSELHFMRVSSQATRPQYEKIAEECKPVVTTAIKNYAKGLQQQRNGGIMVQRDPDDSRRTINDALAKS